MDNAASSNASTDQSTASDAAFSAVEASSIGSCITRQQLDAAQKVIEAEILKARVPRHQIEQ